MVVNMKQRMKEGKERKEDSGISMSESIGGRRGVSEGLSGQIRDKSK